MPATTLTYVTTSVKESGFQFFSIRCRERRGSRGRYLREHILYKLSLNCDGFVGTRRLAVDDFGHLVLELYFEVGVYDAYFVVYQTNVSSN